MKLQYKIARAYYNTEFFQWYAIVPVTALAFFSWFFSGLIAYIADYPQWITSRALLLATIPFSSWLGCWLVFYNIHLQVRLQFEKIFQIELHQLRAFWPQRKGLYVERVKNMDTVVEMLSQLGKVFDKACQKPRPLSQQDEIQIQKAKRNFWEAHNTAWALGLPVWEGRGTVLFYAERKWGKEAII